MKGAERLGCAAVEEVERRPRRAGRMAPARSAADAACPISDRRLAVQAALQVDGTPPRGLPGPGRPVRPCGMLRTVRLAGAALAAAALLPAAPALGAVHTVAAGETLWGIAQATGLSPGAVAAANGLSPEAHVVAGTTLTIPAAGVAGTAPAAAAAAAPATAAAPAATGGGLRVRWGDNLSAIAARNGVSLARLAAVNGLDPSRPLLAGTTLHLPAAGGGGGRAAPPAAARGRAGRLARARRHHIGRPGPDGRLRGPPRRHAQRARRPQPRADGADGVHERPRPEQAAARRHGHQAADRLARRGEQPRAAADDRARRAAGRLAGTPHVRPGRLDRRPAGRARLARRRDRLAGERQQRRDAVGGQRPRRHADPPGHVAVGAGEPRANAPRPVVGRGQRARRIAVPRRPHAPDERRPRDGGGGLLPGAVLRAPHRDAARDATVRCERHGVALALRRVARAAGPGRPAHGAFGGRSYGPARSWRGTSGAPNDTG